MSRADRFVYFIYSRTQEERIINIYKDSGMKHPTFGKVSVGGARKTYTDIVENVDNVPFKDFDVVAKGYKSKMKYTVPNF